MGSPKPTSKIASRTCTGGCTREPIGRVRPLGVAAREDQVVQHALAKALAAIRADEFLGLSNGFRPQRAVRTMRLKRSGWGFVGRR